MSRSFAFLSLTNALCLISFWSLVGLEIVVAKMNLKNENDDTAISLTTISTSFIWVGFVLDNAVCFTEFMVVWLKVQALPVTFYLISALRYMIYFLHAMVWYDLMSLTFASESIGIFVCLWTLNRIISAIWICFMNKALSNKVDGISNPVVHAIGPTGNKAMAGA